MSIKKKPTKEISYTIRILKFAKKGEKTGWTYIEVPADLAEKLFPGNKKSFRVKGSLDDYKIQSVALLPMGGGDFIMPLNAAFRKGIGKPHGAMLRVTLQRDTAELVIDPDLMECLKEEPEAFNYFSSIPKSHQNYFSKWIEAAKTTETKAKRITRTIYALSNKMSYAEMIRARV